MDHNQEAFNELESLGAIIEATPLEITLDRQRLAQMGYTLIFDLCQPIFVSLSDFNYMYNSIIYCDNVIPRTSLYSFTLSQIKSNYSSI